MGAPSTRATETFHWEPQPAGWALLKGLVKDFLARNSGALELSARLRQTTGTRFIDWIDHIQVPASGEMRAALVSAGFTHRPMPGQAECFVHDGAMFPAVALVGGDTTVIDIKTDSVTDFLSAWRLDHAIEGQPLAQVRRALAFNGEKTELWVIERHGARDFEIRDPEPGRALASLRHLEAFRKRRRDFGFTPGADGCAFDHTRALVRGAAADLGRDWACDLFFKAEREYWERRNRAARVQKARQDALGLGWANHDHHTYRSSRRHFPALITLLESLGFRCRERFFAGAEAGWGAQVLEQPVAGITIFADVDMSPEEVMGDFAHAPMTEGKELGTVGLWCALHGEAVFQAGMHHLECQFDWHALKDQLQAEAHVRTMDPFTTFPYLRQAFTEGERWPVEAARIDALVAQGQITPAQAEQFRTQGAVGSHLENLERNDGYKGFNQHGVSQIIAKTDPRRLVGSDA